MKLVFRITLFFIIGLSISCKSESEKSTLNDDYHSALESYKKDKMESRKNNYLQLTGLFRIKEDRTSFGKDTTNTFVLPIQDLPSTIGSFINTDEALVFQANESVNVVTATDSVITTFPLELNEYGSSVLLKHNRLKWQVITRSDMLFLRVWDSLNPAINAFKGFEYYDATSNFILDGRFTYFDKPKNEIVKSEVDGQRNTQFIGQVAFEFKGEIYTLDVGETGFTMVSDATTGSETYGGGRYIYLDLPESNGPVTIDFNRLYNPPCAYNEYTTCLYPPRQNHLPFKVEAGEKIVPLN